MSLPELFSIVPLSLVSLMCIRAAKAALDRRSCPSLERALLSPDVSRVPTLLLPRGRRFASAKCDRNLPSPRVESFLLPLWIRGCTPCPHSRDRRAPLALVVRLSCVSCFFFSGGGGSRTLSIYKRMPAAIPPFVEGRKSLSVELVSKNRFSADRDVKISSFSFCFSRPFLARE